MTGRSSPLRTICVYCGSNSGSLPEYWSAAVELTAELAARGCGIVYGGGTWGLMGAVARTALGAGVPLTGVVPSRFRSARSTPPEGARYLFVETMQERKATMRDLSDGFVALPGGIGTMDEAVETLMLASLGFHGKPLALLDTADFFGPFMRLLDGMVAAGFVKPSLPERLIVSADPRELVGLLLASLEGPSS